MEAFGFSAHPALNTRVLTVGKDASTLDAATNFAAFNVGITTVGPWVGGPAIGAAAGGAGSSPPRWGWRPARADRAALGYPVAARDRGRARVSGGGPGSGPDSGIRWRPGIGAGFRYPVAAQIRAGLGVVALGTVRLAALRDKRVHTD
ncbi:hypothetical protein [Nonomuraea guangzhouensis]|uniref:Uncharacterized protein n=1 Tax=Nonomuraea guangzhouensis TaxID=1291555 RepID=A0ABW4GHG9_9ACTN